MAGHVPLKKPEMTEAEISAAEVNRRNAQDAYDFARSRFVQSMITGAEVTRIVDEASKKREQLRTEIEHLRTLARSRHEASLKDQQNYKALLPHRVTATGIQPPSTMEKLGATYGSDRMYKQALKSSKEYVEARDLFIKRRDQLTAVEENLRKNLREREAAIERQLESAGGHDWALQRDPLLNNAYKRLIALEDVLDHVPPAEATEVP